MSTVLAMCKPYYSVNSLITLKYKCKESITGAKWDKSHVQDRAAQQRILVLFPGRAGYRVQLRMRSGQSPRVKRGTAMCGRSAW